MDTAETSLKLSISEKQHVCATREKVFKSKFNLIDHERMHSGQNPYSCAIFTKKFTLKGNLTKHHIVHFFWFWS